MKLEEVFVSAAQYARLRGVADTYIHQLRRTGRLVLDKHGRIAMRASDELIARTRLRKPRRGTAGAEPGHPWAVKNQPRPPRDAAAALRQMIAEALLNAAHALAPRIAEVADVAACRSFLAQELGRTANKITTAVLAYHHAAAPAGGDFSTTGADALQEHDDE